MTCKVLISRQLARYSSFTFCLLLAIVRFQQAHGEEGSGIDPIAPCKQNCSGVPISQLCASNGKTYDNMCQFENAKCEDGKDLLIVYHDPCLTLPPPAENLCKKHQDRYYEVSDAEYNRQCNLTKLRLKDAQNTLQLIDINDVCYSPICKGDDYAPIQCFRDWCWCSDDNGIRIEGTLNRKSSKALSAETICTSRKSCNVHGRNYSDGLFVPANGCGLCECLDGVVTCFEDYIPASTGELNDTQLQKLKDELMQLFFFQYNHKEHVLIDIRHIHQHPTIISEAMKKIVLPWKFHYYDRDGNNGLSPGEQYLFRREIDQFIHCTSFFDHIVELINRNSDSLLVLNEWSYFFDVDIGSPSIAKRSVPLTPEELTLRRLENKKRFYYTLS